jgi:two-component system KDP operon response regulator KdpE
MAARAPRLLLIDDEPHIVRGLVPALTAEGYRVETAANGGEGLMKLARDPYDVVVLDLGLPDLDGKSVLARLRDWSPVPVIILSARQMEGEKIAALDAGADDYVNKPFGIDELMARLRVAMRGRAPAGDTGDVVRLGDLEIDFAAGQVKVQGEPMALGEKEFATLATLASHAGRAVTHRQLIHAVWGVSEEVDTQFVRVVIAQLRQKLEEDPSRPRHILNELGVGYRLA